MKNPMVTTVVTVALALSAALALSGCAADAEPTDTSAEEAAKSEQPSQPESAPGSSSLPKVEDGTVGVETAKLPVGSSRVDLQACKLEYSIVSPK